MPAITDARSARNPALRSSEGQTYLVGEEVYLRPFAPDDADAVQSWSSTVFPISPDRVRARLADGERGDEGGKDRMHLIVVRRVDDRPVGSLVVHTGWFPHDYIEPAMDPMFGERADRWKGEAIAMLMRLAVDEWQAPIIGVSLRADETATIDRLERAGARQSVRHREMYVHDGQRVDGVHYECLNQGWVERLGDPADRDLPRSGTGQPRPVAAPVPPDGDPPANAIRIGPRVYLRPIQQSDGRVAAWWSTRETDTNWSNGRFTYGSGQFWNWAREDQKETAPGRIDLAVCLRDTDTLIGFVGIDDINYRHRHAESASEMIDPAYRGNGYGSEAKHLMFDYVFNTLGLHMLVSWVMFDNTRSAAALRKQGYREAGRMHWITARDGTFTSMVTFDLLADEWRAMPRRSEEELR